MRVEIFIDPGYTLRHYDCQTVADIEKAKQDFLDELKENARLHRTSEAQHNEKG